MTTESTYRVTLDRAACDGVFACLVRDDRFQEADDGLATIGSVQGSGRGARTETATTEPDETATTESDETASTDPNETAPTEPTVTVRFTDDRIAEARQAAAACPVDAIDVDAIDVDAIDVDPGVDQDE